MLEISKSENAGNGYARIVAKTDTHDDLHFAAIVDLRDWVLANEASSGARQSFKKTLISMLSFGNIDRVADGCTCTFGAGLLGNLAAAGSTMVEASEPDRVDRRRR